jgi:hypothetical protein
MNALVAIGGPANADDHARRRLMRFLWLYEALVITIIAGAGLNIALMAGGSLPMAAPLLLISCAEALRIPLSAMVGRLRWPGRLLALTALLAIAIGSAEGLAIAFEAFLQNRVVEISRAARDLERAQLAVDQAARDRANFAAEVRELDAQVATLASSMPTPPAGSNRTCTWKGQRVTCSGDAAAVAAYREALKAYDARLASLTGQRGPLQAQVNATEAQQAPAALLEARRAFEEKASQSPVYRLTAAVFDEDVSSVTPAQFATVKKFATATLAIAFATLSMAVSMVAHAKLRSDQPSKLARALRAMLAARRKTLRRIRETVRTEYRDRTTFIHVPVDVATGKIVDPDSTLGQRGRP